VLVEQVISNVYTEIILFRRQFTRADVVAELLDFFIKLSSNSARDVVTEGSSIDGSRGRCKHVNGTAGHGARKRHFGSVVAG
jgi:hypothetical protein